ncbi:hypothetical protein Bca52824_016250 [Brassica carinata]|uniref:Uncharacterized protein n=1 Tax=Brassica carinata TaxID=52824 RepID=A0A8X8B6F9_BRACI|nr:hypothetical protein Bca52824_016250 [Brassica carinata]
MDGPTFVYEHASSFTRRELVQETYTRARSARCLRFTWRTQMGKALHGKEFGRGPRQAVSEMNWMFSVDQGLLKRVQRLELELKILRNTQNHSEKRSISIVVTSTSIVTEPTPSTTYSKRG